MGWRSRRTGSGPWASVGPRSGGELGRDYSSCRAGWAPILSEGRFGVATERTAGRASWGRALKRVTFLRCPRHQYRRLRGWRVYATGPPADRARRRRVRWGRLASRGSTGHPHCDRRRGGRSGTGCWPLGRPAVLHPRIVPERVRTVRPCHRKDGHPAAGSASPLRHAPVPRGPSPMSPSAEPRGCGTDLGPIARGRSRCGPAGRSRSGNPRRTSRSSASPSVPCFLPLVS